jgi:hypothetical protein
VITIARTQRGAMPDIFTYGRFEDETLSVPDDIEPIYAPT